MKNRLQGFTLIELMIVVVIIGVLAAIAIPSYQNYVIKSKRSAAQSFMQNVANKEEQYMLDARQYAAVAEATGNTNFPTVLAISAPENVTSLYKFKVEVTSRTYTITATPVPGAQQAGDGTLTLASDGTKNPPGKW